MKNTSADRALNQEEMPKFQEAAALIIFFGVTILLIFASKLGLANWQIALAGAVLMVVCGVLNGKEAAGAIPIWVYLIFVGGLVMANALSISGAGALVGNFFAGIAGGNRSSLIFYAVFFIGPFALTQVIFNQTAANIFHPIAIQTCLSLGVSPVGAMICVQAGSFAAFFTPMATGTVPYMMGAGGYDLKQLFKMSALPLIMCIVVTVCWLAFAFPVF